jgi:hypothetical protein
MTDRDLVPDPQAPRSRSRLLAALGLFITPVMMIFGPTFDWGCLTLKDPYRGVQDAVLWHAAQCDDAMVERVTGAVGVILSALAVAFWAASITSVILLLALWTKKGFGSSRLWCFITAFCSALAVIGCVVAWGMCARLAIWTSIGPVWCLAWSLICGATALYLYVDFRREERAAEAVLDKLNEDAIASLR